MLQSFQQSLQQSMEAMETRMDALERRILGLDESPQVAQVVKIKEIREEDQGSRTTPCKG